MSHRRTILVVGCGAIGAIYAAYLSRVAEVIALDTNPAHVDAINRNGLKLSGRSDITATFTALADPRALAGRQFDAAIFLVKSQSTEQAFHSIEPHLAGRPLLVTLQNGMGNVDTLEMQSDLDIVHGISLEAGRFIGPGEIEHFIHGEDSWIGPARGPLSGAEWLAGLLNACGMPTRVAADPRGAIWSKFIFNSVMNPVGAIVLGQNRARYEVPELAALIDQMFAEGAKVAQAQGIELMFDPMHLVKKTRSGELPVSRHAGSMALDVAAGRETEIEAMTGYLVRKANALGVPVPAIDAVYRLAKGVDYAARLKAGAVT
jgi:2-dehydropantoate 2-reductase